jgi:uncharacterized membrane protein YqgA involved in biofilm formation
MIGLGTIVNLAAIILGGIVGILVKKGLPESFKTTIMQSLGLAVMIIGISGALQGIFQVIEGNKLDRLYITGMIFSLVLGSILGELLKIEDRLNRLGEWFQQKFAKGESTFAKGFVTASLVYCVGAMAIVGALEDGLSQKTELLFAKSILDGVSAIVFTATLGLGVAFSALSVLVYQGSITLLANIIKPLLTDAVISQMSLVGGVLILAVGFNLLEIKRFKVGNMLPAVIMPLAFHVVSLLFK